MENDKDKKQVQKFGTFLGVFTPSVLTILGLIMYLRFGWVVGNVGLPATILIVLLASSITFITGLSASAIATNMRIGVGGEYYIISRSLGLELGGAIGIPLFLCRILSITFYSFGIAETIMSFVQNPNPVHVQILAAIIIIMVTVLSSKSAGLVLKLQIPIMIAVGLSVLALMVGAIQGGFRAPEIAMTFRTAPAGFWYVFAIFFPAVTGFTAGIGMSGDLEDPQRSIPRGTMLAVITGTLSYIFILCILSVSAKVSVQQLAEPTTTIIWTKIALGGMWLVYPGVIGAILSSAFGSVLAGPRVLQSLANDGLAPKFLARLSKTGQPAIATWISGGIALMAVMLGGLNTVAKLVSILFLTLYVIINFSAALEKKVGDPSYRPTINVPWYVSMLGAFGAISVMFLISPWACVVAALIEISIYIYIKKKTLNKQWGDVRAGGWLALARYALVKLHGHEVDPRNWRPHFLLFVADVSKKIGLIELAALFDSDNGGVTVSHIVEADLRTESVNIDEKLDQMNQTISDHGVFSFNEVNVVNDFETGVICIAQAKGMANLKCNTVMFGWTTKHETMVSDLRIIRALANAGISTIIAKLDDGYQLGKKKQIDVWWRGKQSNGDLMLLMTHLLTINKEWRDSRIVLRSIVQDKAQQSEMTQHLLDLISETRIKADAEVIVKSSDESIEEIMHKNSRESDLVFLGLNIPESGKEDEYAKQLSKTVCGFKSFILVRNAGKFAGHLI